MPNPEMLCSWATTAAQIRDRQVYSLPPMEGKSVASQDMENALSMRKAALAKRETEVAYITRQGIFTPAEFQEQTQRFLETKTKPPVRGGIAFEKPETATAYRRHGLSSRMQARHEVGHGARKDLFAPAPDIAGSESRGNAPQKNRGALHQLGRPISADYAPITAQEAARANQWPPAHLTEARVDTAVTPLPGLQHFSR